MEEPWSRRRGQDEFVSAIRCLVDLGDVVMQCNARPLSRFSLVRVVRQGAFGTGRGGQRLVYVRTAVVGETWDGIRETLKVLTH